MPDGKADSVPITQGHARRGMGAEDYCTCDRPWPCDGQTDVLAVLRAALDDMGVLIPFLSDRHPPSHPALVAEAVLGALVDAGYTVRRGP